MQSIGDDLRCLIAASATQTSNNQSILPQLALRMAAANPNDRRHQRLEDANRILVIAFGKCPNAATKVNGG